jgi:hypothetical protein
MMGQFASCTSTLIDWRDEVHGERYGYSSPMRRASEMPHAEL